MKYINNAFKFLVVVIHVVSSLPSFLLVTFHCLFLCKIFLVAFLVTVSLAQNAAPAEEDNVE